MQFALGAVTLIALLMTITMGVVTWLLVREERRRSSAKLSALTAELKAQGITPRHRDPLEEEEEAAPAVELLEEPLDSTEGWKQRLTGVGVAGGLLAVLASITIIIMTGGESGRDDNENGVRENDHPPIELLTLAHEHHNGMISISGTVRNLENILDDPLSVLATAFDADGAIVASGRTQVETDKFQSGTESSFTIELPAEDVSRYRISFLDDETTVPHLDLRSAIASQETES